MTAATSMTVEELAALPDDGCEHELVAGKLKAVSIPHFDHAVVREAITQSLMSYVRETGVGETHPTGGFQLADHPPIVRHADACFFSPGQLARAPEEGYFQGAPAVAVEVVSIFDLAEDLELKVLQFLAAGASAVILIYPRARTVWIRRAEASPQLLTAGQTLELPEVLPGWSLPVAEIFAPLDGDTSDPARPLG